MLYKIGFAVEYFYVKVLANPPSLQSLPATCCSCLGFERLRLVSEFAPPPRRANSVATPWKESYLGQS